MPVLSPLLQPHQIPNSYTGNVRILFPVATLFIFLLILAGCTGFVVPPPEAEEIPSSGQMVQNDSQVTVSEPPDNELAVALTAEATALFKQSLFLEAEEKFLNALEADPSHVPALTGFSNLLTFVPGRWQGAVEYAKLAYNLAPDDATVLSYLTWALLSAHRFDDADQTADAAIAANPESALAQLAKASATYSRYEFELALRHVLKALDIDPLNARAYIMYSSVLVALHDWPTAEAAAAFAIELEPEFHLWKPELAALVFFNDGDLQAVQDVVAPAVQALPHHPAVIAVGVNIAAKRNEWDKALEGCRQMVSFDSPETPFPEGYDCLAKFLLGLEDYEAAARYQDQAEEAAWDERFDISSTRVRLLSQAGECELSRAVAQKWLDARPHSLSAQIMLSIGYMCSDDYEEAIHLREKVVEKWPTSVENVSLLAQAYAANGMYSEASRILEDIESFAFDDPRYYYSQYLISLRRGDGEAALKYALKEAELRPCCSGPLETLAYAYLYLGNMQAAQEAAESAMAKGSTSSFVTATLGYIHLVHGEIEAAEPLLLHSLDKNPDGYLARFALSELYLASNRCEESEPHVNWLVDYVKEEEENIALGNALEECYENQLS